MPAARRLAAAVALAAVAFCAGAKAAERTVEKTVEVSFPAEAVIGLPLPVRLVIHGEAEFPPARLVGFNNPFPVTLASDEGVCEFPARDYRVVKPKRRNYHVPGPDEIKLPLKRVKLERGETCETVLDLSLVKMAPAEPAEGEVARPGREAPARAGDEGRIAPGEYAVTLADRDLRFEYAREKIRLVAPNPDERRLLENLSRVKSERPKWQMFIERHAAAMAGVDAGRFSETGRRQLRYHMLLARLVDSRSPVRELAIGGEDMEGLLPGYRTEVLVLRYEIELARGDADAARATRSEVLAARPDSAMLLDYVASREGLISLYRKAARQGH